jgi:hypothetical protein
MVSHCTRGFIAAGLAAAALLVFSAPAGASIVAASNSVSIGPNTFAPVAAPCPSGTDPVSAGFQVGGFDTVEGGVLPTTSRRSAAGSNAIGGNYSDSATGALTDYAYCDTSSRNIVTRAASVNLPADVPKSATAMCPEGTKVISGGYVTISGGSGVEVFPYRSRKALNGWRASAVDFGSGGGTLRALAYCQNNGPTLESNSASQMTNPAQYHGLATVEPSCPAHTRPISGGFDGHYDPSPQRGVAPLTSKRVAGGWRVSGSSTSASVDAQLTGLVYCEPT